MIDTELEKQKKILINVCLYFLTFIAICFYGMTHALAYDFTDWTGATVNKFAFRATLQNDESTTEWITTTSNSPMTWLYMPTLRDSRYMYTSQFGIELGGFTKEIKSGNNSFQFAIGYHEDLLPNGRTSCSAFKEFTNSFNFQYSTDNANTWVDFTSSMLSCSENDGFFVITILVDVPYTINITNLSFSPIHNGLYGNFIATMFTAFNNISADDSSGTIINQNNQIIYQNQELIDNQNKTNEKLDNMVDNSNENTDKIINSNKETQDLIKDQFDGTCVSKNLFDSNDFLNKILSLDPNNSKYAKYSMQTYKYYYQFNAPYISHLGDFKYLEGQFKDNTQYTISAITRQINVTWSTTGFMFRYTDGTFDYLLFPASQTESNYTFTSAAGKTVSYVTLYSNSSGWGGARNIQLEEGSTATDFIEYGEMECTNKLAEASETSKGILGKIKDILSYINPFSENFFAYKLIDLLIDALKSLFIPGDDFFKTWWNDFKEYIDDKLGFFLTTFDIFINFISTYLNLSEDNIIINIPDITVPNFEDYVIIHAQTFNWGDLLSSKSTLNTLWQLYLDFIDVYLILNFLGLCNTTYARIFGGDTSNYEYYTVDDSYYFDATTGEATGVGKHSERKTVRKKV